MASPERMCEFRWLGTVPYAAGLALQQALVRERTAGAIPDQLLLLEHPHVVTLGRAGKAAHLLADATRLRALGVEVFETGRGGDVTYHGPGQLVAYPILDLAPDRCDLHRYVRDLEQVLLAACAGYGIRGRTIDGRTGVWIERRGEPAAKIAAIGVRVARWITSHGIAFNIRTDLSYFDLIVPCGLKGSAVTSLTEVAPECAAATPATVAPDFAARFGAVFARRMVEATTPLEIPAVSREALA